MRAFSRAIDRFCEKHRRFGIPRLMLYIVIVSAAVVLIDQMDTTYTFLDFVAFSPSRILRGEIWRLVTWAFTPINNNLLFTAIMLYFYYFIGSTLEREWGTAKFTVYYIFGVVLNIIYGFIIWIILERTFGINVEYVHIAPNYLNLSMFFAFAAIFPDYRILLFFFIPVKMKWMAMISAALFVYNIISGLLSGAYIVALLPIVAILNFIVVCGNDVMEYLRPYRSRASKDTINFRKAAKKARSDLSDKDYRHKCSVCGRTDADYPALEFRYCSRCNGFHCFCIEHINNHKHFQ